MVWIIDSVKSSNEGSIKTVQALKNLKDGGERIVWLVEKAPAITAALVVGGLLRSSDCAQTSVESNTANPAAYGEGRRIGLETRTLSTIICCKKIRHQTRTNSQ